MACQSLLCLGCITEQSGTHRNHEIVSPEQASEDEKMKMEEALHNVCDMEMTLQKLREDAKE